VHGILEPSKMVKQNKSTYTNPTFNTQSNLANQPTKQHEIQNVIEMINIKLDVKIVLQDGKCKQTMGETNRQPTSIYFKQMVSTNYTIMVTYTIYYSTIK
jgi:hypothetical protein